MSNTTRPTAAEGQPRTDGRVDLTDRYSVCAHIYECVWWQSVDGLQILEVDEDYSAEQILEPLWDELDISERRLAGRCLSHMVAHGKLPPLIADPRDESPQRYRLK